VRHHAAVCLDLPTETAPLQRDPLAALDALLAFRAAVYAAFGHRRDALFELADALAGAGAVASPIHLSLEPAHRRGWGSFYAALNRGEIPAAAVEALLARHPLAEADSGPLVYGVDTSVWPRCDAETSPARGFYHHSTRHSAGQPIVAGWSFQWVAQLSLTRDSWTAPLSVRRVPPGAEVNEAAARQIRALVAHRPADGRVPLFVFDCGYDSVQLGASLAGAAVALLVRLREGRCFYADPPPPPSAGAGGRPRGRPRRHGAKFACADPATWWAPDGAHTEDDPQFGRVRVRAWAGGHAVVQNHPTRGARGPRPLQRGALLLVEVERLPHRTRPPKPLWLWWHGPAGPGPDLALAWRAYVHRFDLEIVRPQVTKPGVGAGCRRRHGVPDLHVAVSHDDAVNQQLHQLPALLEGRLLESAAKPRADGRGRAGDGADLDGALALGRGFPLAGPQLVLALAQAAVAPLEGGEVDDLGQVGLQQPLPLPGHAGPHLPERRLPPAEFLGDPRAAQGSLHRRGDELRAPQHRAQVGPDQVVQLGGRDEAGATARRPASADRGQLPPAAVVPVVAAGGLGPAGTAGAAQAADAAAHQPAQQVGVRRAPQRPLLVGAQPLLDALELLGRNQGRDRHGDPLLRRMDPRALAVAHRLQGRPPGPGRGGPQPAAGRLSLIGGVRQQPPHGAGRPHRAPREGGDPPRR
jgi:hypothetical protein